MKWKLFPQWISGDNNEFWNRIVLYFTYGQHLSSALTSPQQRLELQLRLFLILNLDRKGTGLNKLSWKSLTTRMLDLHPNLSNQSYARILLWGCTDIIRCKQLYINLHLLEQYRQHWSSDIENQIVITLPLTLSEPALPLTLFEIHSCDVAILLAQHRVFGDISIWIRPLLQRCE